VQIYWKTVPSTWTGILVY